MKRGFTLIELIIAASITAVIGLAVYSTFSTGMSVWRRVYGSGTQEKKRLIRVEKFKKDLQQAFAFRGDEIPFSGNATVVRFPAIVDSEVREMVYSFDHSSKAFLKGTVPLGEIIEAKHNDKEERPQPLMSGFLEGVDNATFSYFRFDTKKGGYDWAAAWNDTTSLPVAVRLILAFSDNETFNETVFVPAF